MELSVYLGELHIRTRTWWIVFCIVLLALFLLMFFGPKIAHGGDGILFSWGNITNIILLAVIIGWYLVWSRNNDGKILSMKIQSEGLIVGEKTYNWNLLQGFVIEADKKTGTLKNLVLITQKFHSIHTIHETDEDTIILFIEALKKHIPRLGDYHQSFFELLLRKSKI